MAVRGCNKEHPDGPEFSLAALLLLPPLLLLTALDRCCCCCCPRLRRDVYHFMSRTFSNRFCRRRRHLPLSSSSSPQTTTLFYARHQTTEKLLQLLVILISLPTPHRETVSFWFAIMSVSPYSIHPISCCGLSSLSANIPAILIKSQHVTSANFSLRDTPTSTSLLLSKLIFCWTHCPYIWRVREEAGI